MKPELGVRPRVYYIGLPKTFIGGTIYDPEADEVVEEALVSLERLGDGAPVTVTTDEFGDFLVDGLQTGLYNVTIRKAGFDAIELAAVAVDKDLNLGDLALNRERGGDR